MNLAEYVFDLSVRLKGANALNIYLLHKLGGQITIDSKELVQVAQEFRNITLSQHDDKITVKLYSTGYMGGRHV